MPGQNAKHWKVLFVCVGNCVRSQMAEAIARRDASDVISAESAGVHPLGFIDKTAIAVLAERGISVAGQHSKGLRDHSLSQPDLVINMSGAPSASLFHGRRFEDWDIEDPFGESMELHRRICDDIEARVEALAARLRSVD
ncbi:MAG: low molecular weight phosphatase family protein [Candidatus Acidiferrales bacterium]